MIRRNTWILLVLLVAVIGFSFYIRNRNARQAAAATPTAGAGGLASAAQLFSASAGAPTDFSIRDTTGKIVEVARNASGVWVLKAPTDAPADQAAAEAAATQVTSLRVLSGVQLGLDVVGLDKPLYVMSLKFADGSSHTLNIGAVTPIQDGYYATLDGGSVKIVDKPGLDALIQLLAQPPYVATPQPPATLTPAATLEVPSATLDLTASPVPALSATPAATTSSAPTPTP